MREGNEGIDCKINFLPPLRLGDDLISQLGEDILLLFGEELLMHAIGELSPWRISGISSSSGTTPWKCLLAWDQREFGFPSFWLVNNAEPEMVVTKDLGGFPFDEKGNGSNGLSHTNERSINKGYWYWNLLSPNHVSIFSPTGEILPCQLKILYVNLKLSHAFVF